VLTHDSANGTYTFTPTENFFGDVALSFGVNDGEVTTNAQINLTVNSINDAPILSGKCHQSCLQARHQSLCR
jgi:hypothetical protein